MRGVVTVLKTTSIELIKDRWGKDEDYGPLTLLQEIVENELCDVLIELTTTTTTTIDWKQLSKATQSEKKKRRVSRKFLKMKLY